MEIDFLTFVLGSDHSTGHSHPQVVKGNPEQAEQFIHISSVSTIQELGTTWGEIG
jgi:acetylornithine/succinyldiaminopimelate/putrescine aminotransferase